MPNPSEFETDDLVVVLLGAPAKSPELRDHLSGVTRLEKLVFLLEREQGLDAVMTESLDYEPYNYGPFSRKVYEAVDLLEFAGLLEVSTSRGSGGDELESSELLGVRDSSDEPYTERTFALTPDGRRYYESLVKEIPGDVVRKVATFKDEFGGLSLRQLVRYVYAHHPDMITKSLIAGEILGT